MLGTFFKLVGKAFRFSINRPLQRFNIANRAKNYLGENAKYFKPAPRAIGALSRDGPSLYPHLEGYDLRRLQTNKEDNFVIEASNKLTVVKTITGMQNPANTSHRPLPKKTNLPRQDLASIWYIDKTPTGRLNLNQLQEIMINKLADDEYWSPQKISETYDIKEEYAENILKYLKQVRIVISPHMKNILDYTARDDPVYQATKDVIYYVDKNLRSEKDRQFDAMYLPTDQIDEYIRELIDTSALVTQKRSNLPATLVKRPKPLLSKS